MSPIKLVQGDSLPYINLSLTGTISGHPINLSDPAVTVRVRLRAVGTVTVLSEIVCDKIDPMQGLVRFSFSGGVLDVQPGAYEGEIEIDFDGQIETLYDTLKFIVRAQF